MSNLVIRRDRYDHAVATWTSGDRIVIPGWSGSYPNRNLDRYGTVVRVVPKITTYVSTTDDDHSITVTAILVVWLDDDLHPRAINQDVVRHTGRTGDHDPHPDGNPAHVS